MRSLSFIIVAIFLVSAFADQCQDKYICVSDIGKNDTCRTYDQGKHTWNLHACGVNQTCTPPADSKGYDDWRCAQTVPVVQQHYKKVGDACSDASECQTDLCNTTCAIRKENDACEFHYNCDVGLLCNNKVCTKQLGIGANCTGNATLCQAATLCVKVDKDADFKCYAQSSVEDGSNVTDFSGQPSAAGQMCKGQVINNGTCTTGEKTKNGYPVKCNNDTDCEGDKNTTGKCNCDIPNKDGLGYCQGFPSDNAKFSGDMVNFASKKVPTCQNWQLYSTWRSGCIPDTSKYTFPTGDFKSDSCYKDVGILNYEGINGASALSFNLIVLLGFLGVFFALL